MGGGQVSILCQRPRRSLKRPFERRVKRAEYQRPDELMTRFWSRYQGFERRKDEESPQWAEGRFGLLENLS